jgi:magnesium transporter
VDEERQQTVTEDIDTDPTEVRRALEAALTAADAAAIDALHDRQPRFTALAVYTLDSRSTRRLARLIGDEHLAEIISDLDSGDAADVLGRLRPADAADVLEEMDPDDAADVVDEMSDAEAEGVLVEMESEEAAEVRELLAYPTDTAGGLMTPEFVAVTSTLNAEEAIAAIRAVAEEAETVYYVYVIDDQDRLVGVLSLRGLVLARPRQRVEGLMTTDVVRVRANADQEQAARILREHRLLALPVVDDDNRLLGIITADDLADVLIEEATEDFTRLGGSQPLDEPYLRASVFYLARKRVIWLLLLFVAQAYTGTVLQHFEDEIQAVVALTFFIPLLIGTGGNVGSQTVTLVVRAMALGEVAFNDILQVMKKELSVGVLMGIIMAIGSFVRAWTLGVSPAIGYVVAVSALFIVIWAATVAAALPILLRRVGVDPSVVSAPFITTLVDGTGLFLYFTVAAILLGL